MPRTKKPPGTAVDRRNGRRELAVVPARTVEPVIERDLFLPSTLAQWDAYWSDSVAASQTPADLMMIMTWAESYDDYLRKKRMADGQPVVKGSQGQQVANPLYAIANASLSVALQCAKQLGVGAKNRADLGMALIAEKAALDDVNARYAEQEVADDDDGDDPRILRAVSG